MAWAGLVALGFGVGAAGTLIGAGGGFVLMPILLLLYPHEAPHVLTSISLAVVFFNALSGAEAYAVMGRIDYRSGLLFSLATAPGAATGALSTSLVPRRLFDGLLAGLLIAGAAFLVLVKPRHRARGRPSGSHLVHRRLCDRDGEVFEYSFNPWLGTAISLGVGYVSSFLGIGGGIIHVPALTLLLDFPVHVAAATSHFVLVSMALVGTVVHMTTGAFSHGLHRTAYLAVGAVLGARLGAFLSRRLQSSWIIRILSLALAVVGARVLVQVFQTVSVHGASSVPTP
jgi:uncharacterized protein